MVVLQEEIRFLKDSLLNEKEKRDQMFDDQQKLFYTLQSQMHSTEKEVLNRLKEHRSDQLEIFKVSEDERQEMYKMKNGTFEGEMSYLKNILKTLERRIDDENAFRVKNEDDLRTWFEQKVNGLSERMKNEEKQ